MKKIYLHAFYMAIVTLYSITANAQQGVTKYGTNALANNTAIYNSAFGHYALNSNTTGEKNTAFGANVLRANNGRFNTGVGYASLYQNTNGFENAALGLYSLFANTTGYYNTALGTYALQANTTAYYNTAIGYKALYSNTNQSYNTAIGPNSLYSNTAGVANTGVGYSTLYANVSGLSNTAMGHAALYLNTSGSNNNAMGRYALYNSKTGSNNNAFGYQALYNNSAGFGNTAIGYNTLYTNTTGNYNTTLGYYADVTAVNLTNATAIGYNAKVNASNKVVIGNTNVSVIGGYANWSVLSDGRFKKDIQQNVPGLEFINKLRPVTYHINQEKLERFLGSNDSAIATIKSSFAASDKKLHTGFVAQEVEKAAKDLNYDFDGVNAPQNDKDNYSIAYADFVPSLVKAIQELEAKVEDLQKQLDNKTQTVAENSSINNAVSKSAVSAILQQNAPNPFSSSTIIRYQVPVSVSNAQIAVTNASGITVKTFSAISKGSSSVTINANELSAGNYYYTLFVDGKKIDTKQMMLIK